MWSSLRTHLSKQMTHRDLRNIHTTRNIHYPSILPADREASWSLLPNSVSLLSGNTEIMICFKNIFFSKDSAENFASGNLISFFYLLGVTPKNGPNSKQGVRKWKNDTKTGITQVLIELQHIFWPSLAINWGILKMWF